MIDEVAYDGVDVRNECFKKYVYGNSVLDLCCGTGFSTPPVSLNPLNRGIDISKYMVNKAKRVHENKQFYIGNAEKYYPEKGTMFDVTTCYFSFHEMPKDAMLSIIENAKQITKNKIIIVDIALDFIPQSTMLLGEPYLWNICNEYVIRWMTFMKRLLYQSVSYVDILYVIHIKNNCDSI